MSFFKTFLLVSSLIFSGVAAAEDMIVSDYLPINVRAPGPNDKIIAAVKSGERVKVLEKTSGHIKVRTSKGKEGWVLKRFLQDEPVAKELLDAAVAAKDAAQTELADLQQAHTQLSEAHAQLKQQHGDLSAQAQTLKAKLDKVSKAAASTLEIQQANEDLQAQLNQAQASVREIQSELDTQDVRRQQMVLGAGILLAGLLLGLIVPFLRPKRSGSWSDF